MWNHVKPHQSRVRYCPYHAAGHNSKSVRILWYQGLCNDEVQGLIKSVSKRQMGQFDPNRHYFCGSPHWIDRTEMPNLRCHHPRDFRVGISYWIDFTKFSKVWFSETRIPINLAEWVSRSHETLMKTHISDLKMYKVSLWPLHLRPDCNSPTAIGRVANLFWSPKTGY